MRVTLNEVQIHILTHSPAGAVVRKMAEITRKATNAVQGLAPVDTGVGRASIRSDVTITGDKITGSIYMARHMWYQATGTGIYGPRKQPIRPVKGRYLVFEQGRSYGPLQAKQQNAAPGSRGLVFAREVKGTPRNHFLRDGLEATVPWPVHFRE